MQLPRHIKKSDEQMRKKVLEWAETARRAKEMEDEETGVGVDEGSTSGFEGSDFDGVEGV